MHLCTNTPYETHDLHVCLHQGDTHISPPLLLGGQTAFSHAIHSINPTLPPNAGVSIDPSNGVLSFSSFNETGEYQVLVHSSSKMGHKNITSFKLAVHPPKMDITAESVETMSWPVTVPASTLVSFLEDITLTSPSQYFIVGGDNVTFDGGLHTVLVSSPTYHGLVQNMGNSGCNIRDLVVVSASTVSGGWIGQNFFNGEDCTITGCASTGAIGVGSGGIVGGSSSVTISSCYSQGSIGSEAGGIVGSNSDCDVRYSYSTGDTGGRIYAGAIMGVNCGGSMTKCFGTSGGVLQDPIYSYAAVTQSYEVTNAGWSDATATEELGFQGDPEWTLIGKDVPWRLSSFNLSIRYNPTNSINVSTQGATQSPPPLEPILQGTVFSIVSVSLSGAPNVSIDPFTGVLTLNALSKGTYHVKILALVPLGRYSLVDLTVNADPAHCFLRGTMIQTPFGEAPIEDLMVGDAILTADLRIVQIRDILRARMNVPFVRIHQGFFAENRPSRTTVLSSYHAILWENHWVIPESNPELFEIEESQDIAEFYHIILEEHEAILANNLPCESFAHPRDFIIQPHPCPIRNTMGIQCISSYIKINDQQKNNTMVSTMISVM